jgi:hypothetical protein
MIQSNDKEEAKIIYLTYMDTFKAPLGENNNHCYMIFSIENGIILSKCPDIPEEGFIHVN